MRFGKFLLAFCALASAQSPAGAGERTLDRQTLRALGTLAPAQHLTLDSFPAGPARLARVSFERVPIYAENAHLYVESASGRRELPRSDQIFLRGYADGGAIRIALVLDPDFSVAHGNGIGPDGSFVLRVSTRAGASTLAAKPLEATLPAGFGFQYRCGNENRTLDFSAIAAPPGVEASTTAVQDTTSSASLRLAVVAIDTDSLFMSRLFSNNTTSATNWIASMFNTMNLMYERDLLVRLVIGTTILRTSPAGDPYTSFSAGATQTQLDAFASYWKTHENAVTRTFAALLSGQEPSTSNGCSASGIAWVNQYCQNGFSSGADTVGSYSVNQVCTSIGIDPNGAFDARLVGHELGHNFGAFHTHCTNTGTGAAPASANTIDKCHSGETGCYSGATSCPAAGAGTIMSYCNMSDSGCAANTQNLLEFHPTHIAVIDSAVSAAPIGCLNTTDDIFYNGFD